MTVRVKRYIESAIFDAACTEGAGKGVGRARGFHIDSAIAVATDLFWQQGYERTSLADLTKAMGITPPSFYFAFGSKEGLFRRVLEQYRLSRLGDAEEALDCAPAREAAEQMLLRLAELYTDPTRPP